MSFHRKQLPILPVFAMTDYKAQGRTLPKVILDIEHSKTLQSAYVMVSHSTCLMD
ncbi:hypothetical protein JB92DRAFT_2694675 [Gautieria morchelliformis]|nr:hypothetical protein JB92DRAFT_2694675 [Gautieria morchelliformis]